MKKSLKPIKSETGRRQSIAVTIANVPNVLEICNTQLLRAFFVTHRCDSCDFFLRGLPFRPLPREQPTRNASYEKLTLHRFDDRLPFFVPVSTFMLRMLPMVRSFFIPWLALLISLPDSFCDSRRCFSDHDSAPPLLPFPLCFEGHPWFARFPSLGSHRPFLSSNPFSRLSIPIFLIMILSLCLLHVSDHDFASALPPSPLLRLECRSWII